MLLNATPVNVFNTCWRLIETWILPGSIIIPDCWKAYSKIRLILSEPYLLNKLSHGLVVSVTAAQTSNVSFEVVGSNLPVDIFIFKILTVKKPFLFTIWEELFQIFISWFLRKYGFQLWLCSRVSVSCSRQFPDSYGMGDKWHFFTMTFLQPWGTILNASQSLVRPVSNRWHFSIIRVVGFLWNIFN